MALKLDILWSETAGVDGGNSWQSYDIENEVDVLLDDKWLLVTLTTGSGIRVTHHFNTEYIVNYKIKN